MNEKEHDGYVILINGSPHASGSTYASLLEVAKTLEAENIRTEIIQIGGKRLHGCMGCFACNKIGRCVYEDEVNEVAKKLGEADGLVVGSPIYYASPNGTVLSFLDRLFKSTAGIDKTMKVGASVVALRRAGATAGLDALNKYFTISGMPVASSSYWNLAHGRSAEEVVLDTEGMYTMRALARNMAFLIKSIKLGKDKFGLPEKEPKPTH